MNPYFTDEHRATGYFIYVFFFSTTQIMPFLLAIGYGWELWLQSSARITSVRDNCFASRTDLLTNLLSTSFAKRSGDSRSARRIISFASISSASREGFWGKLAIVIFDLLMKYGHKIYHESPKGWDHSSLRVLYFPCTDQLVQANGKRCIANAAGGKWVTYWYRL